MGAEKDLFLTIWGERPHFSCVSGDYLGEEAEVHFFSHLLGKGAFPAFQLLKQNIVLMSLSEHALWDFQTDKARKDPRFDWIFQYAEMLKKIYFKVQNDPVLRMEKKWKK